MQYADIQGFTIHFTHRYLLSDLFTIRRLRNYFCQVFGHASTLLRGRSSRKHVCFAFVARTIPMSLGKT